MQGRYAAMFWCNGLSPGNRRNIVFVSARADAKRRAHEAPKKLIRIPCVKSLKGDFETLRSSYGVHGNRSNGNTSKVNF